MTTEAIQGLKINAPAWFEREDFSTFLIGCRPGQPREDGWPCPPATWHCAGRPPNEFSDVFVIYDHGDGSEAQFIPEDIWQEICRIAQAHRMENGVIWLTNFTK